jgi:3'-5' exoribonuclease
MVDNLGGRLGSFDRLEKSLSPGLSWSAFDRAIGAEAFFGANRWSQRQVPEAA